MLYAVALMIACHLQYNYLITDRSGINNSVGNKSTNDEKKIFFFVQIYVINYD